MIDLLFVAWNRRAFTEASFEALLANTDWEHVVSLHVHDDSSTDGTMNYLKNALDRVPAGVEVRFESMRIASPVGVMNRYLDVANRGSNEMTGFVKIDNDFVVCPGWLPDVIRVVSLHPRVDSFGIAPQQGPPEPPPCNERLAEVASHIGGIGLIRHRVFSHCRPVVDGRFGWTQHQTRHSWLTAAWMRPDLPCFELDRLPIEPWRTLAERYVKKGWARPWPAYPDDMGAYWDWWLERQAT